MNVETRSLSSRPRDIAKACSLVVLSLTIASCLPSRLDTGSFKQQEGQFCGNHPDTGREYRCLSPLLCVNGKCTQPADIGDGATSNDVLGIEDGSSLKDAVLTTDEVDTSFAGLDILLEDDHQDSTTPIDDIGDIAPGVDATDGATGDTLLGDSINDWDSLSGTDSMDFTATSDLQNSDIADVIFDQTDQTPNDDALNDLVGIDGADAGPDIAEISQPCVCWNGDKCDVPTDCPVDPSCNQGGAINGDCPKGQSCNTESGNCEVDTSCNHGGAVSGVCPDLTKCDAANGLCKYEAGRLLISATGMRWRLIPPGTLVMGSPQDEQGRDEQEKQHTVSLTRPYWIGEREVTQGEYKSVLGGVNPSYFTGCGDTCPVESVTWYDALYFANQLSLAEGFNTCYVLADCTGTAGKGFDCDAQTTLAFWPEGPNCNGYRLPTEAEWEYAIRAGTTTAWYTGGTGDSSACSTNTFLEPIAWYCNSPGNDTTHPVGLLSANSWNLFDMSGNVQEWCWDWWNSTYYSNSDMLDPVGPTNGSVRVVRGGAFYHPPAVLRSAARTFYPPAKADSQMGFRLVRLP